MINTETLFPSEEDISTLDELPLWSAPFGLKLLERVELRKHSVALDIGFGTGFPLLELAMRLGTTCRVYGIDPWKEAHIRAQRKAQRYNIQNVHFLLASAENIPLENESVDIIVSNNGMNNVADLEQSFAECSRVAKENAQFVLTYNLDGTMEEFYRVFEETLRAHSLHEICTALKQHIYNKRRPLDEFTDLLKRNNFVLQHIAYDSFFYRFADAKAFFKHFFIQYAFLPCWKELLPPNIQETLFTEIEERLNKLAATKGFLTMAVPFVCIESRKNTTKRM